MGMRAGFQRAASRQARSTRARASGAPRRRTSCRATSPARLHALRLERDVERVETAWRERESRPRRVARRIRCPWRRSSSAERVSDRGQVLGARALDELEVVRVVDDAGGVGVLVVDAHRGRLQTCGIRAGEQVHRGAGRHGGARPKWRHASAVAMRPRAVRCRSPAGSGRARARPRSCRAPRRSRRRGCRRPPARRANFCSTVASSLRSITSSPERVDVEHRQCGVGDLARRSRRSPSPARSRARGAAAGWRCAACRASGARSRPRPRRRRRCRAAPPSGRRCAVSSSGV